jgi:predicted O-methyltransferase YrrM
MSISDALRLLWGQPDYAKMPQNLRDAVEKTQWGITVEAERVDEEAYGLKPITEDQLKAEQRQVVLKDIANAVKDSDKPNLMWIGLGAALGASAIMLAYNMNWIPH